MIRKGFSRLDTGLLYLISLLPFFIIYRISDVVYFVLFYIVGYRRHVVQDNLQNAFPEKSLPERQLIEKKYFKYLADLLMETIKLRSISENEVNKRFTTTNHQILNQAFAQGKSVIGVGGHYGNWELGALKFSLLISEPRLVIYKPLSNVVFDNYFIKIRSKFGAVMVPMKSALRKMTQYRKQPSMTLMISDQIPSREEVNYFTNFLNQPTAVFLGVEKMAKALDCVVVFTDVKRVRRGYYNCNFVPLVNNAKNTAEYEITNIHVQYLEKVIRQEPQYWLWSHRRWKYKPADVVK